jgi:hypothetical protein
MTERAVGRSAPQHMKPTPMGKTCGGVFAIGEEGRAVEASLKRDGNVETSVSSPRKPSPPAFETATARGEVAINLIGAGDIRGVEVHKWWEVRA